MLNDDEMLYTGAQYVSRLWVGLNYYEIYFTSLFYVQHLQLRYRNDRSLQPRKPILYYLSIKDLKLIQDTIVGYFWLSSAGFRE